MGGSCVCFLNLFFKVTAFFPLYFYHTITHAILAFEGSRL